jgi:hypothetical protein
VLAHQTISPPRRRPLGPHRLIDPLGPGCRGVCLIGCSAIVTALVNKAAFPEKAAFPLDDSPVVQSLLADGLLSQDGDGYRLTSSAMKQVVTARVIHAPIPLTSVPAGSATQDLSLWHLLIHMRGKGWSWSRLDKKFLFEPWSVGKPLIWCSSGFTERSLHKEYLHCLLDLPRLTALYPLLANVPHGRSKETYVRMLTGIEPPVLLDAEDPDPQASV